MVSVERASRDQPLRTSALTPANAQNATDASAPLGAVIVLSASMVIGAVLALAPVLWHILPITELDAPFPSHHQDAETLVFVLSFAVLLPLAIVGARRVADRISAGQNRRAFPVITTMLCAALSLVVIGTRISGRLPWPRPTTLAVAAGLWCLGAAVVLRRVARDERWEGAARAADRMPQVWAVTMLMLAGVALAVIDLDAISVPALVVGTVVATAVFASRDRFRLSAASSRAGVVLDTSLIVLLALAVPNLVVFTTGTMEAAVEAEILQFHQNFYLGPANQILFGDAMLVDVLSQYGVGSIYFLAAAFTVLPIGNLTLALVEGVLSALMFIATFCTLRIAGVSRMLASATMVLAVTVLVYGLEFPLGGLLQHGAFRFGLPVGVVVGAAAESRWPRRAMLARGFQLATIAIASVWALEAFAYTTLTAMAIAGALIYLQPADTRRPAVVRWAVQLGATIVLAHTLFAGATLWASGELPDWGWYVQTLRAFLGGAIGDLTYDFSSFSPGLALGAFYLGSACALAAVLGRRREAVEANRTIVIALVGMSAWGISLFTYVVNRGADHIIPYVSLPAVALAALWLDFIRRPDVRLGPRVDRSAVLAVLGISVLLVASAWPLVGTRYSQSALAHAVPGGESLSTALGRMRVQPTLRPGAAEGAALLETFLPGEERSIVLADGDLGVEIVMRADRGSAVPLGDPWEDSLVPGGHLAPLGAFVDQLSVGDRALIDGMGRLAFDRYREQPDLDPLASESETSLEPTGLASLQEWVIREIGTRFDLTTVERTDGGFEVVELTPRGDGG